MTKIGCIVHEIFNVLTFFHATHFPSGKGRLSCATSLSRMAHFLWSRCTPIIICKTFDWKRWVISEIHNTFCFILYLEKVENGATFLESKTIVIGCDAAEFWSPSHFLITCYRQRDWTFGVFLEIFMLHN